jgi:signal transduction histidine kinase
LETPLEPSPPPQRLGHDLGNQLAIILGFTELLLAGTADGDPRKADLHEIDKAAQTAMLLVSKFLLRSE